MPEGRKQSPIRTTFTTYISFLNLSWQNGSATLVGGSLSESIIKRMAKALCSFNFITVKVAYQTQACTLAPQGPCARFILSTISILLKVHHNPMHAHTLYRIQGGSTSNVLFYITSRFILMASRKAIDSSLHLLLPFFLLLETLPLSFLDNSFATFFSA